MSATVSSSARVAVPRPLYIGLSGLMAVIAIVGFWPGYVRPLLLGSVVKPLLIHVHAVVFTGWLVLFFTQAYLAATKRIHLHLKLGQFGMWYGVLLVLVGLTTGVISAARRTDGLGEVLLLAILEDMLMFAGFFGIAIWYRRKPKVHRPAMVVAATALLVAAVGRMEFLPTEAVRLGIWSTPVLIAMAAEYRNARMVHPVYLVGLIVFVVRVFSIPVIAPSASWGGFADWVFRLAA